MTRNPDRKLLAFIDGTLDGLDRVPLMYGDKEALYALTLTLLELRVVALHKDVDPHTAVWQEMEAFRKSKGWNDSFTFRADDTVQSVAIWLKEFKTQVQKNYFCASPYGSFGFPVR